MLFTTTLHSPGGAETTVSFGHRIAGLIVSVSNTLKLQIAESPAPFFAVRVIIYEICDPDTTVPGTGDWMTVSALFIRERLV
jgi:hypothetical protein